MARGNSSSHSNARRPGKSNKVTAAAAALPTTAAPNPTHRHSHSVVPT